jgi:uncharacterized membrane protein YgdD (TMEM256/DUF423 family)
LCIEVPYAKSKNEYGNIFSNVSAVYLDLQKYIANSLCDFLFPNLKIRIMKNSVLIGAYSMALAVLLGAFGAHSLKSMVSEYSVEIFNKGVYYQVIHSLGILISAFLLKGEKALKLVRVLFLLGVVCFSGSLYLLTFSDSLPHLVKQVVGPITPIGGVFFVFAWAYLGRAFQKEMNN